MLNFEKYKDEILEIVRSSGEIGVDGVTGKPRKCSELSCDNCKFSRTHDCTYSDLIKWFCEEYKEPKSKVKISSFAKEYLSRLVNCGYQYLARDESGFLHAHKEKPSKLFINSWGCRLSRTYEKISYVFDSFYFIKWEDEEPWAIQDILDNCEVVED